MRIKSKKKEIQRNKQSDDYMIKKTKKKLVEIEKKNRKKQKKGNMAGKNIRKQCEEKTVKIDDVRPFCHFFISCVQLEVRRK